MTTADDDRLGGAEHGRPEKRARRLRGPEQRGRSVEARSAEARVESRESEGSEGTESSEVRRAQRYGSGGVVVILQHLHCPVSASAVCALPLIAYVLVRGSVKTALRNLNDPLRELIYLLIKPNNRQNNFLTVRIIRASMVLPINFVGCRKILNGASKLFFMGFIS